MTLSDLPKTKVAPTYRNSPAPMYQNIIAQDPGAAPAIMREYSEVEVNTPAVPREQYTSQAFFDLEVERMWSRVWQVGCREEQIPEPGDCVLYEAPGASLMIVRLNSGRIKAFYNSCLHRGMKLCATNTSVRQFRCPFHGLTWNLDGTLARVPARWDFDSFRDEDMSLPEAKTGIWGGFVFVNRDPDAPPLDEYLGRLVNDFADWPRDAVYLAANITKVINANWKACIEAFMEAYHVAELHSEALPFGGDSSTQYDIWPDNENVSRFIEPVGVPSDQYPTPMTEQQVLAAMHTVVTGEKSAPELPEGVSARAYMADLSRKAMSDRDGRDYSQLSDAEALDPMQYSVFPNFIVFRGLGYPFAYRFRPLGNDPGRTIFDFMVFKFKPTDGSAIPEVQQIDLGPNDLYADAGILPPWQGHIYDQDSAGLAQLQAGLSAGSKSKVIFTRYQEVRLRFLHQTLSRYLAMPPVA